MAGPMTAQQIQDDVNAQFGGPWKHEFLPGTNIHQVVNASGDDFVWLHGDNAARNGRLIEAAPKLLAACRHLVSKYRLGQLSYIGDLVRVVNLCEEAVLAATADPEP